MTPILFNAQKFATISGPVTRVMALYEFGQFRLDTTRQILLRENTRLKVSPQSLRILQLLIEHAPRLVSAEEIKRGIGFEQSSDPRAIIAHTISDLRRLL